MIACDRPLVCRWQTNRLTCASLGWYLIRRRCSRQRKLANPLIRKGRLDVKRIFAYLATIISWIRSFCHGFFRFLQSHFCSHFALSLLDKTLTPVKGWKKQTNKQTNKLVCRLAFPHPFLPASKRWWLHRQNNSKLAQVSLLTDWFIVHLGIVVT